MAKKIYVCAGMPASEIAYERNEGCGIDAYNVQDAIDAICDKMEKEINDKYFEAIFYDPLMVWKIVHGLNKMVSVTLEDLDGNDIEGDVEYVDSNTVLVRFSQPVSGKAYMN